MASEGFMLENFRRTFSPDQTDYPWISSQDGEGLDSHMFLTLFFASVHANLVSRSPKAKGKEISLFMSTHGTSCDISCSSFSTGFPKA